MNKEQTLEFLKNTSIDDMPAFYTMSYNRNKSLPTVNKIMYDFSDEALKKSYIVVRESQKDFYYNLHKDIIDRGCNLLVIPEGEVSGVGSTRNWIIRHAYKNGNDIAYCFDDDLTGLTVLFESVDKKGEPSSGAFRAGEIRAIENFHQLALQAVAKVTREIIAEHPEALIGNVRKVRFSNKYDNAATKYKFNKGGTPRQTNIYNVKAMVENNIFVPDCFNKHGDDIGVAAYALEKGYSLFSLPWVAYAYTPETVSSTLRDIDEEKNRAIHEEEYNNLMKMEIKDYLRFTKSYEDGSYMYGDIAFNKFHKLRGTKPLAVKWS